MGKKKTWGKKENLSQKELQTELQHLASAWSRFCSIIATAGRPGLYTEEGDPRGQETSLVILLGSPQMTNTLDTESPSRNASRCLWPSNHTLSSEGPLNFMSLLPPAPLRNFSRPSSSICGPEAFLPPLFFGILFHCCLWSCLCEAIMIGSIPLKGARLNLLYVFWITARLLNDLKEKKTLEFG